MINFLVSMTQFYQDHYSGYFITNSTLETPAKLYLFIKFSDHKLQSCHPNISKNMNLYSTQKHSRQ